VRASVDSPSDPASFCDDVNVSVNGEPFQDLLTFTRAKTPLASGATTTLTYSFTVDNPSADYTGKTCAVSFIYEASQYGYNFGEAFHDSETDSFVLNGDNFGTVPPPPEPPVETDCCCEGDVTVINDNDATIVNNI